MLTSSPKSLAINLVLTFFYVNLKNFDVFFHVLLKLNINMADLTLLIIERVMLKHYYSKISRFFGPLFMFVS